MSELEGKFHQEMLSILPATIELKLDYRPTGLNRMLLRRSGHLVAKELIRSPQPSEGFLNLIASGHPEITVESKVLLPEYHDLFTDGERQLCKERLAEAGYLGQQ